MAGYTDLMGAAQARTLKPKKRRGYAALAAGAMAAAAPGAAPAAPASLAGLYDEKGKLSTPGVLSYLDTRFGEARSANERRYGEALDLARRSREEALAGLEGYGRAAKQQVDLDLGDRLGGIDQDAINRGIFNFTTKDALGTMARESAGRQKAAIDENAARLRAEASTGGYQALINLMASRQDEYPDVGGYLGLLQQERGLSAEREEREKARQETKTERARLEGKRIVHTRSDPIAGTVTEFYADGSSKTYQVNPGPQPGSYYYGRTG